jgi:iron complex outermembrane receptor protein
VWRQILRITKTVALIAGVLLCVNQAQAQLEEPIATKETPPEEVKQPTESKVDDELDSLLNQDITQLRNTSVSPSLDIQVTSVERQKSTIGRTPSAVFVITQEMIQQSGSRTVPELLRMVPGLHVAHIDGNKWSISSRGFGGRFSNKLLVQIDGRTVYTPLFAGVYWDAQDVLLDNIERIEVVRGPGATAWGANAVNGVVNIITKSASQTHGTYVMSGGGTTERGFSGARVGGQTQQGIDWQFSGNWFERDNFVAAPGGPSSNDGADLGHVSFRTDWEPTHDDTLTLQGDYYDGKSGTSNFLAFQPFSQTTSLLSGENVLGRWTRTYSADADSSLQAYYDRTHRVDLGFTQTINVVDIDYQNRFRLNERNTFIWGTGYRNIWDDLSNDQFMPIISADPAKKTVQWYSAFGQNQYTISEDLAYLTVGSKLSHDTFAKWQVQPSARLLMLPSEQSATWLSVSRAVRTPSRATRTLNILVDELPPPAPPGTPLYFEGSGTAAIEKLIAYEWGYREQTTEYFSWDLATFYNVYDDFESSRLNVDGLGLPVINVYEGGEAKGFGYELYSLTKMTDSWSLRSWYSFLRVDVNYDSASIESPSDAEGSVPKNQAYLMSSWTLPRNWQFDLIGRYSDTIPALGIDSYTEMDARISWRKSKHVELTVVGQNLLDRSHPEYGTNIYTGDVVTEVPRGVYGMVQVRY